MMKNVPTKYVNNKSTDTLRAAVENQAKWIYYLTVEGMENGLSCEFAKDAMKELGEYYADTEYKDCDTAGKLSKKLMRRSMEFGHEAEIEDLGEEGFDLKIGYCPMVNLWSKLTDDEERIGTLCDVACSMYDKIAEKKGLRFEKTAAITQGCEACRLSFRKE
ncbi:MAG: hypothetical protein HFI63_04515 [Lachnospiraceae bacterium]|nr:hypothetical protein [Lachnospiraceae bacterium]